jgi:hypothetical protein
VECRVIAAAGQYVLLYLERFGARANEAPHGECSLTYLDGVVPMGWDGSVESGTERREVRFKVTEAGAAPDRRRSVRLPVSAPVDVQVGNENFAGRSLDVSAGGMRLRHPGTLAVGATMHLRLRLPDGPLLDADAVVRKSERGLCSVEFTQVHSTTAQEIGVWTVASLRAALAATAAN